MRVRSIELGDDEMPVSVTVDLTIEEAEVIAALAGAVIPSSLAVAAGPVYERVPERIYDSLVGSVFNRFWENGLAEVMTSFASIDLRRRRS